MNYVIIELSNYIMCFLLGVYLIESVWPLFLKKGDMNHSLYIRQSIYTILIYTLGTVTLLFNLNDNRYLILYVAGILVMFIANRVCCTLYKNISRMLLNHMCLLLAVSFIILSRISFTKAFRQLIIVACCVAIFAVIPFIIKKFQSIDNLTYIFGAVGILMLILVLSLGKSVNGSKLSFHMLGLTFQPSEIVKLLYVFLIAGMLKGKAKFSRIALSAFFAAIYVLVLVLSRDLGSALIFFMVYLVMLYVATNNYIYSLIGLLVGGFAAYKVAGSFSHVMVRISAWKDPWSDINKTGYQLAQSLFGIGTGNWFGMGLGKGNPTSIPLVDEDFIFSAISEELGVVFGIILILVFLACSVLFLKIAIRTTSKYYRMIVFGLSTVFIMQVILTIGGGTRFIPLTGVTLPLVSNGGSSAASTIILFGIIAGISIIPELKLNKNNAKNAEYQEEFDDGIFYIDKPYYDEDGYYIASGYYDADGMYIGEEYPEYDESKSDSYDEYEEYEDDDYEYYEEDEDDDPLPERRGIWKFILPRCDVIINLINIVVFIGIICNLCNFMINDRFKAINNSYNSKRLAILEEQNSRGTIYASDGSVIASTVLDTNGNEIRQYPYGNLFSHVVGYSTYGKTGIEDYMNVWLISSDSGVDEKIANDMNGVKNKGDNVYTTLDPDLQKIAGEALGAYRGAVIVTEAKTGRILAMVSKPDFDPNTVSENMASYQEDKTSTVLLNRASQGLYPPGSTFKIITSMEYLRQFPGDYNGYGYTCNGKISSDGSTIKCYHGTNHGYVDFKTSFAKSCNSSFANIGLKLDRDKFADSLDTLLFNEKLPVDFEYKSSYISVGNDISTDEMMQTSIGQGHVLMTPLHLNMITQAIANDGVMLKPYAVDYVTNSKGAKLIKFEPEEIGTVMSQDEVQVLTDCMEEVVKTGTAKKISGYGYSAAGKTGSAEFKESSTNSHAWFTGFAPVEDPEIVVTVIIENIGSGGDYSAPIARQIFSEYFAK